MNIFNYPTRIQSWVFDQQQKKSEAYEQILVIEFLEKEKLKYSAIPMSTYTPSWMQKMKNKVLGTRPGVPDLLVIVRDELVFIEMKRVKGGVVSPEQKEWVEALNKINNVSAHVCRGYEEAKDLICNLLKN